MATRFKRTRKKSTRKGMPRRTARLAYSRKPQGTVRRARRKYAKKSNPLGTEHTKEIGTVIAITAGGAAAGFVEGLQDRGQLPDLPMNLEPSLVLGAALVAVPIAMKMKGKNATIAALLGTGMLAAAAKEYVSNAVAPADVAIATAADLAEM